MAKFIFQSRILKFEFENQCFQRNLVGRKRKNICLFFTRINKSSCSETRLPRESYNAPYNNSNSNYSIYSELLIISLARIRTRDLPCSTPLNYDYSITELKVHPKNSSPVLKRCLNRSCFLCRCH